MVIGISAPRRSSMRGSTMCSSPAASVARARPASTATVAAHDAGELTEGALGEMKRGLAMRAERRALPAGDHERTAGEGGRHGIGGHAGEVDDDLDGRRRFR